LTQSFKLQQCLSEFIKYNSSYFLIGRKNFEGAGKESLQKEIIEQDFSSKVKSYSKQVLILFKHQIASFENASKKGERYCWL